MSDHALLSASGAPKWVRCYGSLAMEAGLPNNSSRYADEGTAAHELADLVLNNMWPGPREDDTQVTAHDWVGHDIVIPAKDICHTVDFDMAGHVQNYVDEVRSYAGHDGYLQSETRVNYSNWLGVPEDAAWGTSDAIIVRGTELIVVDLKYGQGERVYAKDNEQLRLYALGSYNEIEAFSEIETVRMVIYQPRVADGITEDVISLADLKMWARTTAAMAAQHALRLHELVTENVAATDGVSDDELMAKVLPELTPGDKQCRWCRAKARCPALAGEVVNVVSNNFVNLDELQGKPLAKALSAAINVSTLSNVELSDKMKSVGLIEAWLKDIRATVEAKLFAGETVPGYKIVQGKQGDRKWADDEAALKVLKRTLGAKDAVKPAAVISAPQAEKLLLKTHPAVWTKLQKLITRTPGQPSVAPESDPREALDITPSVEAFAVIEDEADDVLDLI